MRMFARGFNPLALLHSDFVFDQVEPSAQYRPPAPVEQLADR
jgi:hypothetical protein